MTWTIEADDLPAGVAELGSQTPRRLHGLGDRDLVRRLEGPEAVTIVGSRHPSAYGLRIAGELGFEVASAGVVVVSGMAIGIDAAAHRGALEAGGPTVAVLGCGPDVVYPRRERELHRRIAAEGAIVAEYEPGTPAAPHQFPERNRIMAALGGAVVVVEATDPSGSLITADEGIRLGRAVGAVPGPVGVAASRGTNRLIKDGGELIRDARDVLDLLFGVGASAPKPRLEDFEVRPRGPRLDPLQARVLDLVASGAASPDRIAGGLGIRSQEASIALAQLELLGYVEADATGGFNRTPLATPVEGLGKGAD
ncbi:MAG TPA: DNA-processing protein DprA [Solirubrobacterales bacterium]|nr:DNA-processing protein DprA [Solirubrobacterales bacterium]